MQRKLIYKVLFILLVTGVSLYFTFPLDKRINLGLDFTGRDASFA